MKKYITISILIHLFLIVSSPDVKKENVSYPPKNIPDIIEVTTDIPNFDKQPDLNDFSEEALIQKKLEAKLEECTDFYGGIGLTHDWVTNSVIKVYEHYPAFRYGIRPGDVLLNVEDLRGAIGDRITVRFIRNNAEMNVNMVRGKICNKPL